MTTLWPCAARALPRPATCAACSAAYGSDAVGQADACRGTRAIFIPWASFACPGCHRAAACPGGRGESKGLIRARILKQKGTPNKRHAVTYGVCLRRKHYQKVTPESPQCPVDRVRYGAG